MSERENIKDVIDKLDIFDVCRPGFVDQVLEKARLKTYSKNHILFLHQDAADKFFIVKKGWVKLYRETLDGSQAVIDILPAEHMFGETSIFENNKYPYTAETAEPTEIISIPLSLLKEEIKENPAMAIAMLTSMAHYRRQQDQELEHRAVQNAPQRIGCFLLRLADQNQKGKVSIHLPYDKTLVALRLGMQPETFSRALSKLRQATGIKVKGATIEMDNLQQISSYSCSACSSEFPCKDLKVKSVSN